MDIDRRDFMKLAGLGGIVFASGLGSSILGAKRPKQEEFYFVQLSDTHIGFDGPKVNPDAKGTLKKAVAAVNSLDQKPDFIVFTGDAAKSLMFPLPAPGSAPKRAPIPWDATAPYKGIGYREIEADVKTARYGISELAIPGT